MADVLDPPTPRWPDAEPSADAGTPTPPAVTPAGLVLAALLAGAGGIHLAMAPSHLGTSGLDGGAFLVAGWVQVGLATLVVLRPNRRVLGIVIGVSAASIAAWVVSRTVGLPVGAHAGEAEDASFVDGVCVALEALTIIGAAVLLRRPAVRVPWGAASIGVVAALAFATAAIASPSARTHGGEDHAHGGAAEDHAHGETATDDLGFSALANGQMGDHDHRAGDDHGTATEASLDPVTAGKLASELALTAPLIEAYPTLGDALAAGYWQAGPFSPGLGTHLNSPGGGMNNDGVMDAADIANPILIYDGLGDDAPLAGFMYLAYQETEPEGFAGPLDRWHYHTAVCIVQTERGIDTPFGADLSGVTTEMCEAEGGTMLDFTGYMVHVWTVPGYESSMGTFSDLNPKITCPDGTYHTIPMTELGDAKTTCRNR